MIESKELKRIKKKYGEDFMKLCRGLFPTLLETEGRLEEILNLTFAGNNRTLCADIVNNNLEDSFKDYIYSKIDVKHPEKRILINKTPYELLEEVGYDLTECLSEKQIQEFRKYYVEDEELCTFNGGRLEKCVVFFAVKKNADDIKRKDFKSPRREDEYGTSVMGIQFTKKGLCTVSIKNRYNHTVNNPDATYGNNLDRIVPGLTQSFADLLEKNYGLELNSINVKKLQMPNYVVANDGKYYKYNVETNGIYYCPGNVIIENGEPKKLENPESQILIDYFILDIKNKTLQLYDKDIDDCFVDIFKESEVAKIQVEKSDENNTKIIKICKNDDEYVVIEIDRDNSIIGYENQNIEKLEDCFLYLNRNLSKLKLPKLKYVGEYFLSKNRELAELDLPNVEQVGDDFLTTNTVLYQLNLPKLQKVGSNFLVNNIGLRKISLPCLEYAGNAFLSDDNEDISQVELPKLRQVGNDFLYFNQKLEQLDLPSLEIVGDFFLSENEGLKRLNLPKLHSVGDGFMNSNESIERLELPNLEYVKDDFLSDNFNSLISIDLPRLRKVGHSFLYFNECLSQVRLPSLELVGPSFLYNNLELVKLELANLKEIGINFMYCNKKLRELRLPRLERIGTDFLANNESLERIELPDFSKIKSEVLQAIEENRKRIDSQAIAMLDKNSELATSDMITASCMMENVKGLETKIDKDEKYKNEVK